MNKIIKIKRMDHQVTSPKSDDFDENFKHFMNHQLEYNFLPSGQETVRNFFEKGWKIGKKPCIEAVKRQDKFFTVVSLRKKYSRIPEKKIHDLDYILTAFFGSEGLFDNYHLYSKAKLAQMKPFIQGWTRYHISTHAIQPNETELFLRGWNAAAGIIPPHNEINGEWNYLNQPSYVTLECRELLCPQSFRSFINTPMKKKLDQALLMHFETIGRMHDYHLFPTKYLKEMIVFIDGWLYANHCGPVH